MKISIEKDFNSHIGQELSLPSSLSTQDVVAKVKNFYQNGLQHLRVILQTRVWQGEKLAILMSELNDKLVHLVHDYLLAKHNLNKDNLPYAFVAIGGYGRKEMAPFSDIDIMFLLTEENTKQAEELITDFLYILWDLKLKLGQQICNINEAMNIAQEDLSVRTAMLDSRYILGNKQLFGDFKTKFNSEIVQNSRAWFVMQKLVERDVRHEKMGNNRYLLEPNIKEGKGGLRDMQTLTWLMNYVYDCKSWQDMLDTNFFSSSERKRFRRAYRFLWSVRFWLHFCSNRANEVLHFELQRTVAQEIGYRDTKRGKGVERFMRHYFLAAKDVGILTAYVCVNLEEKHSKAVDAKLPKPIADDFIKKGCYFSYGRLKWDSIALYVKQEPILIFKLIQLIQANNYKLHPNLFSSLRDLSSSVINLRENKEAAKIFLELLKGEKVAKYSRLLNDTNILSFYLPEFSPLVCQMQYNMYHYYTTDEHVFQVLNCLESLLAKTLLEESSWANYLIDNVVDKNIIYLAVLFHDIGKGRGGDHSIIGKNMAQAIGKRMGFSDANIELVSWLVEHHLIMSSTAFRRDLDDSRTIDNFVSIVSSKEKLVYLVILTICDISGVGPNVWNVWKGNLLQKLFWLALQKIENTSSYDITDEAKQETFAALSNEHGWQQADFESFCTNMPNIFWSGFSLSQRVTQALWLTENANNEHEINILMQRLPDVGLNQISLHCENRLGIFASMSAALAKNKVNIVNASFLTLNDNYVNNTIYFTDMSAKLIVDESILQRIEQDLHAILVAKSFDDFDLSNSQKLIGSQTRKLVFDVPIRVKILEGGSSKATLIEVSCVDKSALLFVLAKYFFEKKYQVVSAIITTYGEKVVDTFYIKNKYGLPISSKKAQETIKKELVDTVAKFLKG